jgi:hypothetical protein
MGTSINGTIKAGRGRKNDEWTLFHTCMAMMAQVVVSVDRPDSSEVRDHDRTGQPQLAVPVRFLLSRRIGSTQGVEGRCS